MEVVGHRRIAQQALANARQWLVGELLRTQDEPLRLASLIHALAARGCSWPDAVEALRALSPRAVNEYLDDAWAAPEWAVVEIVPSGR